MVRLVTLESILSLHSTFIGGSMLKPIESVVSEWEVTKSPAIKVSMELAGIEYAKEHTEFPRPAVFLPKPPSPQLRPLSSYLLHALSSD